MRPEIKNTGNFDGFGKPRTFVGAGRGRFDRSGERGSRANQ